MPDNPFQDALNNPDNVVPSNDEIIKEIEADNEKDYLKEIKKKNKGYLVNLDYLERERVAAYLVRLFNTQKTEHKELCDKIDEYDEVFRMTRKDVPGDDGTMPNYRTPISAVTVEVVHANIMNVIHTPIDIMRVLPTEEGDVSKVNKISIFGNWSMDNELNIFERTDRLFHSSTKIGECPYIMYWFKDYGTEIKREILRNPADPSQPLIDPDTKEPLYQEIEKPKLLYNGPKLEVFSRKNYHQPTNAQMDVTPNWESRDIRLTYDQFLREELQGHMYIGAIKDITDWSEGYSEGEVVDFDGSTIPADKYEQEFEEFYLRMRVNTVKDDKESETEDLQELEDEFIAIVHIPSETLCCLRKNKFPLKMRPIGIDYFIPDDEGRRKGLGAIEMMDGPQKSYDVSFNQLIFASMWASNPAGFFTPMGNQRDEPIKLKLGYMFPTADPKNIQFTSIPQPNNTLQIVLDLIRYWAQILFGISDYSAGMESQIDPSAPARKAELVVAQGSVRLNIIIKRKNKTLQDIFRRWFLLYQANMPKNKFMRVTGSDKDNPWKFESVSLSDFALNSIPDFQLVGNILNVNKSVEFNKKIAIYQVLSKNPLFLPTTAQGLKALHGLTKWLIDGAEDNTGLGRLLPEVPGEQVMTPEEENARFLQGDYGEPMQGEDHVYHIRVHQQMIADPTVPDNIKSEIIAPHINKHVELMQQAITQQMVLSESQNVANQFQGGRNAVQEREVAGSGAEAGPMASEQFAGMG